MNKTLCNVIKYNCFTKCKHKPYFMSSYGCKCKCEFNRGIISVNENINAVFCAKYQITFHKIVSFYIKKWLGLVK